MEEDNEAAALKKEIEFLTNLINGAGSTSVTHGTQQMNRPDISSTRQHTHLSSVTQTRHALVKPTPKISSKYSLTRVPTPRLHNSNAALTHGTQLPGTSQVYVKNNLNQSLNNTRGVALESTQRNKSVPCASVSAIKDKVAENPRTCGNPVISAPLQKAASKKETSSSAPRRIVKVPSVGSLGSRNVQTQIASNTKPNTSSTSVKRTVCLPNSDVQKKASSSQKSEVKKGQLVRSRSDTCLQSMSRVVIPSQLKRSATSLTFATSAKPSPTKNEAPKDNTMSPTVIKAGKKIIEEIERLNRVMIQLERCSQRNASPEKPKSAATVSVETAKPVPTTQIAKSTPSVPSGKCNERIVLPLGSTGQFAVPQRKEHSFTSAHCAFIKKDKYRLVKATTAQELTSSSSVPTVLRTDTKTASDRLVLHPAQEEKSKKNNAVSLKPSIPAIKNKSPYKLVRTSSGSNMQLQASSPAPRDKHVTRANTTSPFKLTRVSTPQRNKYKLTRRNSLSGGAKRFAALSPIAIPRRRVYLTRRRLQNMPTNPQLVTKPTTVSTKAQPISVGKLVQSNSSSRLKSQTSQTLSVKSGQSDEVKSLLYELAIIDTAFKTAKLQSSQKLLKRALLTKQKMMQRKNSEKNIQTSPVTANCYSRIKWATPAGRRPRLRSHSRSKSPSKGHKSWNSRFSLKKSSPGALSINQLLGRTVDNASSNKYKFINRGASSKSSARKFTHRSPRYLQSNKNRLKVDRRTPAQRAIEESRRRRRVGRQHVSIGGVVYKTSQRKLTRASPKRVVSKKGVPKPQTRTVSVGGYRYRVTQNRLTLLRVNSDKDGVKHLSLGGVKYIQTKPGTLVRATDSTSRTTASRFIYRSIATAAAAAVARNKKVSGNKKYCMFYNRFGKCNRGDKCPYLHDPDKVAVCTRFLRGTCKVTDCPFSHKVEPEKMPVCTHFLRGVCSRDACPYRHVKVSSDAELCQDFVNGYCPLGDKCKKKHSRVCPKHDGKGGCPQGTKCKLFHPRRGEKRPVESGHRPAVRKPRIKTAEAISSKDVEMHITEDEDRDLPLGQRHLPSFISIRSEESAMDVSSTSHGDTSFAVDEPLQIRPNLSFDAN